MTLDPRTYDVDELRDPRATGTRGNAGRRGRGYADRYRRLVEIEHSLAGDPKKPYLHDLPATLPAEVLILEWLASLLDVAGRRATIEALRYYREIGWLAESVERTLVRYLCGLPATDDPTRALTAADHADSLLVIARLASAHRKD